ncbi:hypothetical protein [Nannocystis radixulma]|uniref:Ferritin-like domain-containing protein n=1 Tax=Nannocystis radixulma TaxID=2995305 RepID=A0ABT5B3M3_9BACT|nr:hypothetical protein [Nannocystis radixulma]MDC0668696.1 hypothetical protein [Nannocystis radixulma]
MWSRWREYFEVNARRPLPPIDAEGIAAAWRAPLMRSLAIFQVGESGEGRIVQEIERSRLAGVDADYRAALKLFVKEEGRHARLLAAMVRGLGGSLRRSAWTDRLFVRGRRLLGLRLKLLVLLVAEVIGIGFYGLLAERLGACPIGQALREICGDEQAHLEFHCTFFRLQTASPWRRAVFTVAWFVVAAAACVVVLVDHRATLRALAIDGATRRLWGLVTAVRRCVCTGEAVAPAPARASVAA